jgi:hypothetical protein
MHAKNLNEYLAQADSINALMPQALRLIELRHVLLKVLPETLAGTATVANYRQGKIIIFAANAAAAAKLKLLGPTLLERFAKRGFQVTALKIEVQPGDEPPNRHPKEAVLSDAALRALDNLASQLTDSELKTTIAVLAESKSGKR